MMAIEEIAEDVVGTVMVTRAEGVIEVTEEVSEGTEVVTVETETATEETETTEVVVVSVVDIEAEEKKEERFPATPV